MNTTTAHCSAETVARIELITAILDAAAFIANVTAEEAASFSVCDRTLPELLEHGYQLSQKLTSELQELE